MTRRRLALAIPLATAAVAGCGHSPSLLSLASTRSCLESEGMDTLTPAHFEILDQTILLGRSLLTPFLTARPALSVAGSSEMTLFFEPSRRDAANIARAFGLPAVVRSNSNVLIVWRHPAAADSAFVQRCISSKPTPASTEAAPPAHPFGCVIVYVRRSAKRGEIKALRSQLAANLLVKSIRFVSVNPALARIFRRPRFFEVQPKRARYTELIAREVRRARVRIYKVPCGPAR